MNTDDTIDLWIAADNVNKLPREPDGSYRWKCESCGKEFSEALDVDPEYDRTKDKSNWPVLCDECGLPQIST